MTLQFMTRFRSEADDWTTEGSSINAGARLDAIRRELEEGGPVILEHHHYNGARAPTRLVFDDFDAFCDHLEAKAIAGDSLYVWAYREVCTSDRALADGKCPAEDGAVPLGGAY